MYEITEEKTIYSGYLKVQEAQIKYIAENGEVLEFPRTRILLKNAVAVFIYNKDENKAVLVKQFRYAVADRVKEMIPEIVAGTVNEGEEPVDCAIREVMEESGYRIKKQNIRHLASCFASPGYSSEKTSVFYAEVTNKDKMNEGGGVASENEHIETIEMNYNEFMKLVDEGKIEDSKTLIAALYLRFVVGNP